MAVNPPIETLPYRKRSDVDDAAMQPDLSGYQVGPDWANSIANYSAMPTSQPTTGGPVEDLASNLPGIPKSKTEAVAEYGLPLAGAAIGALGKLPKGVKLGRTTGDMDTMLRAYESPQDYYFGFLTSKGEAYPTDEALDSHDALAKKLGMKNTADALRQNNVRFYSEPTSQWAGPSHKTLETHGFEYLDNQDNRQLVGDYLSRHKKGKVFLDTWPSISRYKERIGGGSYEFDAPSKAVQYLNSLKDK